MVFGESQVRPDNTIPATRQQLGSNKPASVFITLIKRLPVSHAQYTAGEEEYGPVNHFLSVVHRSHAGCQHGSPALSSTYPFFALSRFAVRTWHSLSTLIMNPDCDDLEATMALAAGEGPLEAVQRGVKPYEIDGFERLLKLWKRYELFQRLQKRQLRLSGSPKRPSNLQTERYN
jgi:hypothetical protein